MKIPLLKYLFGQENKEHTQNEIVFAITPHIVRSEEVTDENVKLIDIGSGSNIGLRYKEPKPTKTGGATPGSGTTGSTSRTRPTNGTQTRVPTPGTTTPVAAVTLTPATPMAAVTPAPSASPPATQPSHPN
jgi:general secretion pathway protein D